MLTSRALGRAIAAFGLVAAMALPAAAQQKVRFAYLKSTTLIPFFFAIEKGYFKAEGIDLELIAVAGGPAVAAALAGGSADIGYAAPTPIAIAREQGQPYKFFIGLEREKHPDDLWGTMLASERSGVKKLADLKGKTIIMGPPGGLCELTVREWVSSAGLTWADIKPLYNPFPQMMAALEVGNADAACIIEPFTTAVQGNDKIKAVQLSKGYLVPPVATYSVDGVFAKEDWIAANPKIIEGIKKAALKAWNELAKEPKTVEKILTDEFRFPPTLISRLKLDFVAEVGIEAQSFAPIIERMKKHGMLKPDFDGAKLVHTGK